MPNAVIISRNKTLVRALKRAVDNCDLFNTVETQDDLDKVGSALVSGGKFAFVFIDETFENIALASFIENAKRTDGAKKACFVLVCEEKSRSREIIGNALMTGFHAFLSKPFNVSNIQETIELALKVNGRGSKHRLRAATGLLLSEIVHGSKDEVSGPTNLWKEVEASCNWYKQVTGDSVTLSVVDPLHQFSAVERVKHYKGVSERVRSLIKERLKNLFLPS